MTTEKKAWYIAILIWIAGAGVLAVVWNTRVFISDTMESIFGFALYVVAFGYCLVLGPLKEKMARWLENQISR